MTLSKEQERYLAVRCYEDPITGKVTVPSFVAMKYSELTHTYLPHAMVSEKIKEFYKEYKEDMPDVDFQEI